MLLSFPLGQVSILLYKAVVSVHYQVMLNCSVGGAVLSLHKIMRLCLFKTVELLWRAHRLSFLYASPDRFGGRQSSFAPVLCVNVKPRVHLV